MELQGDRSKGRLIKARWPWADAYGNLAEGYTGAAAASAAALGTGLIITATGVALPAVVAGGLTALASYAADYAATSLYQYIDENGAEILSQAGQNASELAQTINTQLDNIATSLTDAITTQATNLSNNNDTGIDTTNLDDLGTWISQVMSSVDDALSNAFQAIGGGADNQTPQGNTPNITTTPDGLTIITSPDGSTIAITPDGTTILSNQSTTVTGTGETENLTSSMTINPDGSYSTTVFNADGSYNNQIFSPSNELTSSQSYDSDGNKISSQTATYSPDGILQNIDLSSGGTDTQTASFTVSPNEASPNDLSITLQTPNPTTPEQINLGDYGALPANIEFQFASGLDGSSTTYQTDGQGDLIASFYSGMLQILMPEVAAGGAGNNYSVQDANNPVVNLGNVTLTQPTDQNGNVTASPWGANDLAPINDGTAWGGTGGSNNFFDAGDGGSPTFNGGDWGTPDDNSDWGLDQNYYNYTPGDGDVTINPGNSSNDGTLNICVADPGNLTFQADDSTGNLTITDGTTGDQITINAEYSTSNGAPNDIAPAGEQQQDANAGQQTSQASTRSVPAQGNQTGTDQPQATRQPPQAVDTTQPSRSAESTREARRTTQTPAATRPRGYQGLPPLSAAAARMSSAMGAAIDMVGDISPENVKSAMRMALDAMGAKEGAMRAALREMERENGPLIPRPQQRPQTPPPATTQPAPTSQPPTVPPVAAQQTRPATAPAPEAIRTQPPTQPAAPAAPVRAAAEPGLPFIPPRDPRPLEMRIITEPARPSAPAPTPATAPAAEPAQPPRAAPPTVRQEASEQTPPRQKETTPPAPKPKNTEVSRDAGRQPSLFDSPPPIAGQPQTPAKKPDEPESKQPNAATAPTSETPELTPEQLADKNRKARRRAVLRAKGRGGMGR